MQVVPKNRDVKFERFPSTVTNTNHKITVTDATKVLVGDFGTASSTLKKNITIHLASILMHPDSQSSVCI